MFFKYYGGDCEERFDFERAYLENLIALKKECEDRCITPTRRQIEEAKIASAFYALTDLSNRDSMGSFFLNSQDPDDGLF